MSQEDYPTDFILNTIEAIMPPALKNQPKVLLFDIGGVCVASPFQAILDYELTHKIPAGWINHSISRTAPHGSWHQLERGEILLDKDFFRRFNADLRGPERWKDFYRLSLKKQGILVGKGDEIPPVPDIDGEYLFWAMMRASRDPDPWMLPALMALRKSGRYILAALSNTVIFPPDHEYSRSDPSPSHTDPRPLFDVFISSAHVGLRKPSPEIYALALREVDQFARENRNGRGRELGWGDGVRPGEIVFLDDIGENLKEAQRAGFVTVKVHLGRAFEAVEVLEEITGLELAGSHPKVAVKPRAKL